MRTFLLGLFSLIALHTMAQTKKVLIVVTSFGELKNGDKTGIWAEEFITPYYMLKEKGFDVTIASPKGGKAPLDPRSLSDASVKKFQADPVAQQQLNNTVTLQSVKAGDYDAIYYPGGHGPMWDLVDNKKSLQLISTFYEKGKPVALVCHAPAVLKNVKVGGEYLVKGKKVAGFTNSEEKNGGSLAATPFSLEDMLKERGAKYESGADWAPFAVQDGLLITGQNPASAGLVAEKLVIALK